MTITPKRVLDFCASYGFAVVILGFLLLLTLFGTLEQVEHGLFQAQKKYFESFFLLHHFGPIPFIGTIPVPLPGVYLLMILLFINLLSGAIIRAPKDWRRPGMLIAHGGILFMIIAGFVTYEFSVSGHMTLYERQSASHFSSYYDFEIAVIENTDDPRKFLIDGDDFQYLDTDEQRVFHHAELPFELRLDRYFRNAQPQFVPGFEEAIDGVLMRALPLEKEAERNVAGAIVTLLDRETGMERKGLLWGISMAPWKVSHGDTEYLIDLRHKRYPVPFTITLDKFIRELHPRTGMAANFESEVTKVQDGQGRKIDIRMNEPLRHEGYTFFQASWGPPDAGPNDPLFSTFAVVNNPADQWPKYSCYIIAFGLTIHFLQKLAQYLKTENRRRAS